MVMTVMMMMMTTTTVSSVVKDMNICSFYLCLFACEYTYWLSKLFIFVMHILVEKQYTLIEDFTNLYTVIFFPLSGYQAGQ